MLRDGAVLRIRTGQGMVRTRPSAVDKGLETRRPGQRGTHEEETDGNTSNGAKRNFAAVEKGKQTLLDQRSCDDADNRVKIRHHVVGDPVSFHLTGL